MCYFWLYPDILSPTIDTWTFVVIVSLLTQTRNGTGLHVCHQMNARAIHTMKFYLAIYNETITFSGKQAISMYSKIRLTKVTAVCTNINLMSYVYVAYI